VSEKRATPIDEYLAGLAAEQRTALERLRATIRAAAPDAIEKIYYQMPAFYDHGPLVAYAAFKNHVSFFVMSTAVLDAHEDELGGLRTAKGTISFKPEKPLPDALVKKLVRARLKENLEGKGPRRSPQRREKHPVPDYVTRELERRGLTEAYEQRPPYQRNDYIGWITRARQEATRQKRLDQMLEELESGDVYMKMPWKSKRDKPE
jgi:uncharacterized protein YdhG (YjbR/CyaY superfamily)